MKIGLEVLLISAGVFLGLMGEQWREHTQHRELAEASLRRFRTEIRANQAATSAVHDYHVALKDGLEAFFKSGKPKTPQNFQVDVHGLGPVFYERTAWDLALANGSLAYIDADLAFALSRVYTSQQGITDQQRSIVQSTVYGRSWSTDFEGYWRSVLFYLEDIAILEPAQLKLYEDVLPKLDRALGESTPAASAPK